MVEVDSIELATTTVTIIVDEIPESAAPIAVITIVVVAVVIAAEILPQNLALPSALTTAMKNTKTCEDKFKAAMSDQLSTSAFKTVSLLKRGSNHLIAKMRIYGTSSSAIGLKLPEIQKSLINR